MDGSNQNVMMQENTRLRSAHEELVNLIASMYEDEGEYRKNRECYLRCKRILDAPKANVSVVLGYGESPLKAAYATWSKDRVALTAEDAAGPTPEPADVPATVGNRSWREKEPML